MKAQGVPGSTLVGVPDRDNNLKQGMIRFDIAPRVSAVAKEEFNKGWTLCKVVTRSGVPVVVIG